MVRLIVTCTIVCFCVMFAEGFMQHVLSPGILTSANYPAAYSTNLKDRTWIHAPAGKLVKIDVTNLNLPNLTNGTCAGDNIRLYDGYKNTDPLMATLCGTASSGSYVTTQTKAYVAFKTDRYNGGETGYRFSVSFLDAPTTTTTTDAPTTTTTTTTTTAATTTTTTTAATTTSIGSTNINWFNGPCGTSVVQDAGEYALPSRRQTSKIYGGVLSVPGEFPFMVLIQRNGQLRCGGSVINDRWIITAAHCLQATDQNITLIVGVFKQTDTTESSRQVLTPNVILRHPLYNAATYDYDMALIRTQQTINFNSNVQPICPPSEFQSFTHQKAVVAGWGSTETTSSSSRLLYTTLNVTSMEWCRNAWGTVFNITDRMICAHDNDATPGRDTCSGDSGGPLAVKQLDDRFVLAGITSFGLGCANVMPGGYTCVSCLMGWIQTTLDSY